MKFFHRKILHKSTKSFIKDDLQLPQPRTRQPPPPISSINHSSKLVSPFLIFMFCGLAFSFLFISYLVFIKRYQSRRRLRNRGIDINTNRDDFVNEDVGPEIDHPIWLINTVGLDQSQIESIHVFKYRKNESSLMEGGTADCSVCLSEFEDDESLRLLPMCNHAFHVPCIDTWLRSHKNCPLCRAPIFNNTNDQTTHHATTHEELNTSDQETETRSVVVGSETTDDHDHVVEVENIGGIEKNLQDTRVDETKVRVHTDLADHHRVQSADELFTMRRSFSNVESKKLISNMPWPKQKLKLGSSSSIHMCSKVMKSFSFGHSSSPKASSFTTKCAAHNRSY